MFLEAIFLGILLGMIRGGRLSNLSKVHLRGGALIILILLVQLSMVFWSRLSIVVPHRVWMSFALSVLLFIASSISLSRKSFFFIPVGALLNVLAMAFNHMKMPVMMPVKMTPYFTTLKSGILSQDIFNYTLFTSAHPIFKYLGKIILLPDWYYGLQMLSMGDVLISIGLFLFIQNEMNNTLYYRHGRIQGISSYRKSY